MNIISILGSFYMMQLAYIKVWSHPLEWWRLNDRIVCRPHRVREAHWRGLHRHSVLHGAQLVPLWVPGMVPRGARLPSCFLQVPTYVNMNINKDKKQVALFIRVSCIMRIACELGYWRNLYRRQVHDLYLSLFLCFLSKDKKNLDVIFLPVSILRIETKIWWWAQIICQFKWLDIKFVYAMARKYILDVKPRSTHQIHNDYQIWC